MKKMKVVSLTLMMLLLLFCCAMFFAACDETDETDGTEVEPCDRHSYEWEIIKLATCTEPGKRIGTCKVCGFEVTDTPLETGHSWKNATCTEPKTCSVCSATQGSAAGHSWKNATCTVPKTCSVCSATTGSAKGHSYSERITVMASCSQNGTKKFTCSDCGKNYSESYSLPVYAADEVFEMSKNSVGEIITYNKSGSELALGTCFVYSADGKIITNYHVIEDAYSAKITLNGVTYTVQYVLAYDKAIDLAVLKINASNLSVLPICYEAHAVGKTVYAFGSSKGLTATFSQGIITAASREMDGVNCVQHDAAISSGNSGGPLINQYGEIIGINTFTIRDSQNLNFAISTSEIKNLTYGTPLTVSQFYEKECNVFTKLKNYAVQSGTYSSADLEYSLTLGYSYSSDYSTKYTRIVEYDVADDVIRLLFYIDDGYLIMITIDEIDGVYAWGYSDYNGYVMIGTLYANTYTSSTLLGYSNHNITSSSILTSIRKLASSMVNVLCSYMDSDFAAIGVTAEDIGFLYY